MGVKRLVGKKKEQNNLSQDDGVCIIIPDVSTRAELFSTSLGGVATLFVWIFPSISLSTHLYEHTLLNLRRPSVGGSREVSPNILLMYFMRVARELPRAFS